jgi:D-alanyl-D-alanine carboxypeptidase
VARAVLYGSAVAAVFVGASVAGLVAERADPHHDAAATRATILESQPAITASTSAAVDYGDFAHSIDDPTSPWVVVNKSRPLEPRRYVPPGLVSLGSVGVPSGQTLRREAAEAFAAMWAAAAADGVVLQVATAYRSYGQQSAIYYRWFAKSGRWWADRESARPGYSEHQTGWSLDLTDGGECHLQPCFARTAAARWVSAHGWEYGFVVRYTADKESVTGFRSEPWHIRYVGVELATLMRDQGVTTLEEYFGLPAAPSYA